MCQVNLLEDLKMDLPCLQNKDVKNAILLSLNEMEEVSEALAKKFKEIAEELINNYCIVKKKDNTTEVVYRFMELEFYFCSPEHPDVITYPRNANAGDWFFHNSGVDICFQSNVKLSADKKRVLRENDSFAPFGGILIRALSKEEVIEGKETGKNLTYITGPLNCCYELFDKFPAFYSPENDSERYLKKFPLIKKCDKPGQVKPSVCGRYFNFSTTLKKKFENIYKDSWKEEKENNANNKSKKEYKDVQDSSFNKYWGDFQSYLENKYCFYDEEAFEQYNKLGKSYQANPTKPKKDKEGKVNENWRLSYKE